MADISILWPRRDTQSKSNFAFCTPRKLGKANRESEPGTLGWLVAAAVASPIAMSKHLGRRLDLPGRRRAGQVAFTLHLASAAVGKTKSCSLQRLAPSAVERLAGLPDSIQAKIAEWRQG